mgnify:CR=1 FL=1
MKRRLISLMLSISFALAPMGAAAKTSQEDADANLMQKIFGNMSDLSDDSLQLPYKNGARLSDIREPLYTFENKSKVFGDGSLSWKDSDMYITFGASADITVSGKSYTLDYNCKKVTVAMAEGDFDADGRKNQIAALVAAKTTGNKSLLLLCVTQGDSLMGATPAAVLYEGGSAFYDDINEFVNCMEIVCADINGDGYDEIITTTPTSGYGGQSSDKYGFDRYGGSYVWSLKEEGRTALSWKDSDSWDSEPQMLGNSLQSYVDNCYLGAPGVTASMAAADIDGDGYDDIVSAIAATKVQYNPQYASSMFMLYYIGGAPTAGERYQKRINLSNCISGTLADNLSLGITSGNASGFDVEICDIDNSGTPTIFMSIKETVHSWSAYSGEKMYTPSYYVVALDYNKNTKYFKSSTVHHGGIYHHGWVDSSKMSDSDFVYNKKVTDCAPVRIGVLKDDFGYADEVKAENPGVSIISSGTLIADQTYIPFVRCADGYTYSYFTKAEGLSYTGHKTNGTETITGFTDKECVFFNNGINVYDIKTANVGFDGKSYEDAAFVRAYTKDGFNTYFLSHKGNGYESNAAALFAQTASQNAVAMPDVDSDSVYLRYEEHAFFWADPVIIAALASPPYFDALPSDAYVNGATTYGRSISSSTGASESFTISAGAYLSVEAKAGAGGADAVFEAESEALKSQSNEKENTIEVSYTQSFSASGGDDTVVLATVGYDAYLYTAFYGGEDGTRTETPYVVYVPHNGSDSVKTASLSRGDYDEFKKYAADVLPDLDGVFKHTVGKPETYWHGEPTGSNILSGSVMIHKNVSGFPANTGSQTQTIEITKEKSSTTSAGMSVSAKLGGGFETSAENILKYAEVGTKITGGYVQEKEYERGKIETRAVGTSFEGTVFGQGDGFNTDGKTQKAGFNWKLLHYVYDFNKENAVQRFPVITYITSDVTQPAGAIPSRVTVSPESAEISQVGPATKGYINKAPFTVTAEGLTREAYTALEGAPFGMSLNTGGTNIGSSAPYAFDVVINGNVKPGSYDLRLNVGGVLSNVFTVTVTPYEAPTWITADKTDVDFGSVRYDKVDGTPSASAQAITVSSIHTEKLDGFTASLGENSPFTVTQQLSSTSLAPQGTSGDSATVMVAPKTGLSVGTHTDTLTIANRETAAYVTMTYTVTEPTLPGVPKFSGNMHKLVNPIKLDVYAPSDDGGEAITDYLYTIRDHENYTSDGEMIWKKSGIRAQSGTLFTLTVKDELTVGNTYVIGIKAVNVCGESIPVWFEFEVGYAENDPDPVRNMKVYPEDGKITVTWDEPSYWGENEHVDFEDILFKSYQIWLRVGNDYLDNGWCYRDDKDNENEYTFQNLTNDKEYEVLIDTRTLNRYSSYSEDAVRTAVPSLKVIKPSRPKKLTAEMSYKQAKLSWNLPGATGNTDITGYKVSKDGGINWTDVGGNMEYTFTGLVANQTYDFAVCAVNSAGDGDAAHTYQTVPNSLAAPELVDDFPRIVNGLIPGYEQLELVWKPVEPNMGGAVSYEVRLDDGEWQAIEPIAFGDTLRWIFTELENERKYTVSVRAVDSEGAGPSVSTSSRKPRETAPRPIMNVQVKPRNNSMQLYGEAYQNMYRMEYSINGGSWQSFSNGERTNQYYENGKEYTVAISSQCLDNDNMPMRTTQYFKCTPDENVPDEPSEPIINATVSEDNLRIDWSVEDDGGEPILYYELSLDDDGEPIRFPADVTSFDIDYTSLQDSYCYVYVYAVNSVGKTCKSIYVDFGTELMGESILAVPSGTDKFQSEPYRWVRTYYWEDETGKPIAEEHDYSDRVDWNMTASDKAVTWDKDSRRIIAENLPDGTYDATVTACDEYRNTTYEKKVKIIVGNAVKINSAEQTSDGISVNLDLPESLGVTMCIALYNEKGALSGVSLKEITAASLTDGKITVPVNGSGTSAKIMLLENTKNMRPMCGSKSISIK